MRRFLSKLLNPRCVYINLYNSISEIPRYFNITNYLNKKQNFIEFNNFKKNKNFFYKIRESFLSIFISSYDKDIISILDIGGGFNNVYDFITNSSSKKIDVTVLETKMIVDLMKPETKDIQNLDYIEDINNTQKNFDIIYFGTSFQYFISLEEFLSKIFKLKAKYIVIADTIFLEKRNSLVTLQINTFPSIIPQKFNNIDEVINLFKNSNYNLIYKSKRKPGKHNMLKKNEYFYRDLIFECFD
ncbi:MAG: hypothetical protein ACJZ36_03875 [Candidatus Pelagibacter sp.]